MEEFIMIKLKDLLKEWNDTSFKKLPKRWTKSYNKDHVHDGLTEFEKQGGKDELKEENESTWTVVYKGLLAGFRKGKDKRLEVVAKAVAFLIKTEYGRAAKNDFIKAFKKSLQGDKIMIKLKDILKEDKGFESKDGKAAIRQYLKIYNKQIKNGEEYFAEESEKK